MRYLQCRRIWFVLPSIGLQKTKCKRDGCRGCKHSKIQMNMLADKKKYMFVIGKSTKSRLFE